MKRTCRMLVVAATLGALVQLSYPSPAANGDDGRRVGGPADATARASSAAEDPDIRGRGPVPRSSGPGVEHHLIPGELESVPPWTVKPTEPGPVPMPHAERTAPRSVPIPQVVTGPRRSTRVPPPGSSPTPSPNPRSLQ